MYEIDPRLFNQDGSIDVEAAMAAGGTWNVLQQFGVQLTAVLVAIAYAAILTLVILVIVQKVIGLRMSNVDERQGMEFAQDVERQHRSQAEQPHHGSGR